MTSKINNCAFWASVFALAAILIAFDVFLAVMIWNHGFPTEIFKSDYTNWPRRVVFTWWDGVIVGGVCLGHILIAWVFLRERSRRIRVGRNAG